MKENLPQKAVELEEAPAEEVRDAVPVSKDIMTPRPHRFVSIEKEDWRKSNGAIHWYDSNVDDSNKSVASSVVAESCNEEYVEEDQSKPRKSLRRKTKAMMRRALKPLRLFKKKDRT